MLPGFDRLCEQRPVRLVGERQSCKFPGPEPRDAIVLVGGPIRRRSAPGVDDPDFHVQRMGCAVDRRERLAPYDRGDPEFLLQFANDRVRAGLGRLPPTLLRMGTEEARTEAANRLRDLIHAFAAHDTDDDGLAAVAKAAAQCTQRVAAAPLRDRLALMRQRPHGSVMGGLGFEDRAVGGHGNPTGIELEVWPEGDEVVAKVVLRRAFEGAPGRAHGGIVAAAFDDVTGFIIGGLQEPAFTGELTVRYLAPVPVDEPLEIRARLDGRERRKLFISADMRAGETPVATCRAIYITVDPSRFAGAPDPR
jgi:acyl-coenzyme A thioesterase PaaI-like protein